uniref:Uncharacterized protein n=1 Tax=Candidatus Desulfatibia profunda TaxID=2841695 RepID=A0A8J6NVS1_9BACT|nr:hypothetical protein [Candidatus Desulfatibia profunda]
MIISAIDPGTFQSAYVEWDGKKITDMVIWPNEDLLHFLSKSSRTSPLVIEMMKSYGNAIGQSTLDTIFWSGRFAQAWGNFHLLARMEVKKHLCNNHRAKDSNIIQALVDRFAYGQPNRGKGTKKHPGFFYGFNKDIWQAFALAVTFYDLNYGKK